MQFACDIKMVFEERCTNVKKNDQFKEYFFLPGHNLPGHNLWGQSLRSPLDFEAKIF